MAQFRAIIDSKRGIQDHIKETLRQLVLSSGFDDTSANLMLDRFDKLIRRDRLYNHPIIIAFELHNNEYSFTLTASDGLIVSAMYFN
jgi:hypothetical protein